MSYIEEVHKELIMSCLKHKEVTLHSGQKSNYIFDVMELIPTYSFRFFFSRFVEKDTCLVGIDFGGAILATLSSNIKSFAFVRKDGSVYGNIPDNYTLIDDVVTTENSIRTAIQHIGKIPKKIKCVVDRREDPALEIESMLKWKEDVD